MSDKIDSQSYWEFREATRASLTSHAKDIFHLQEAMDQLREAITEFRLQDGVNREAILKQIAKVEEALLAQIDLVMQSLLNEQKAREKREQAEEQDRIKRETLKAFAKYGAALCIACFLIGLMSGADSEAAVEIFAKLLNLLIS